MSLYDYNYHNDPRVAAVNRDSIFKSIDTQRMKATIEYCHDDESHEVEMPIEWAVCWLCNGRGTHVNPAIDCGGLTAADFYEDPDFAEDYFSGKYDQICNECGGRTTVPVISDSNLTEEQEKALRLFNEEQEQEAQYRREAEWERRMGM